MLMYNRTPKRLRLIQMVLRPQAASSPICSAIAETPRCEKSMRRSFSSPSGLLPLRRIPYFKVYLRRVWRSRS